MAKYLAEAPDLSKEALDVILDLCELELAPLERSLGDSSSWGLAS
ncbi:hypothetical protein [Kitasatospora acidiphila]